jgi:hypothetical protein
MDYKEPKTRKELKGNKSKDIYNQKAIRLKEALMEKTKDKNKDKNKNENIKK